MLDALRSSLRRGGAGRRMGDMRRGSVGAAIEGLESRCMLSVSPSANYVEIGVIEIPQAGLQIIAVAGDAPAERLSLRVGAETPSSMLSLGRVTASAGSTWTGSIDFIVSPITPGVGTVRPGSPSSEDWGLGLRPRVPPLQIEPSYPPIPDDGSPSEGFIDIGELETTNGPALFTDPADRAARDVMQMLSSLNYLPNQSQASNAGPPGGDAGSGTAATLRNDLLSAGSTLLEEPASEPTAVASPMTPPPASGTDDAPANEELTQGGMISLVRQPLIEDPTVAEAASRQPLESLRVPVQLDSAIGKFQAFEVSTTEEVLLPPAAADPQGTKSHPPLNSATESTPEIDNRPLSIIFDQIGSQPDGLAMFVESTDEEQLPAVPPPAASGLKRGSLVSAAVGVLIFSAASRAVRPPAEHIHPKRKRGIFGSD